MPRCTHTMTDGEGALYRCIDQEGHAGAHPCAPVDAHPAPTMERDPYGALAADETAVKAALATPLVDTAARMLRVEAASALTAAGIEGRTVRVVVEATIAEGATVAGAPLVVVRP